MLNKIRWKPVFLSNLCNFWRKNAHFVIHRYFKKNSWRVWRFFLARGNHIFLEPTLNDPLFFIETLHLMPLLSFSGRHMYVIFIFECPPLGLQFKRQFSSNKLALTYLKQCKTTFLKAFCKFWNWLFVKDKNYKIREMYHVGPLLFNCCCCCCFYNFSFPRNHSDRVQDEVKFTFLRTEKYNFYAIKILLEYGQQGFLLKI